MCKSSDIPDTDDVWVFFCQLFVYIHFIISIKNPLIDGLTFTDSSVSSWLSKWKISPVRQNILLTFTSGVLTVVCVVILYYRVVACAG